MRRHPRGGTLDFVAIGHVVIDHVSGTTRLGGAAAYAAMTASRLGLSAGIVTSVGADFPFWHELSEIEVHFEEAPSTTEFENLYVGSERRQRVLGEAGVLTEASLDGVRARLSEDAAVLYCPVLHEVRMPLASLTDRGLAGLAPQGFFREWGRDGIVARREWTDFDSAVASMDLVSMSEDDDDAPEAVAESFPGYAFVVTMGASGCRVYSGADVYQLPAFEVNEIDPTGAGDVFAAAMLVAMREERSVRAAASFAAAAASFAVEGPGMAEIPNRAEVESRLRRSSP